jgi:hypothetical protein
MARFVQGENRSRATLLPAQLNDYVSEDNPVRIVLMPLSISSI